MYVDPFWCGFFMGFIFGIVSLFILASASKREGK